jgi:phosphinothricin acetyltransferase
MDWKVRNAESKDIIRITEIYNQGIEDRVATFETRLREAEEMTEWLLNRESRYPVLVIEDEQGAVQGWASVNSYNSRCCYSGVGDLSIYVHRDMRGKGFGRLLLEGLIASARKQDFHKLILNAFDSNEAAINLYLALGFRHVGTYEKQGLMDGKYVDVTIMEKLIAEK